MFRVISSRVRGTAFSALAVLALIALGSVPAAAGTIQEQRTFDSETLTVRNLIGAITVEGHSGSEFLVEITIQGQDATSGLVKIETGSDRLDLVFPDKARYVYPRLGAGSRTKVSLDDGDQSWLGALLNLGRGAGRIEVRGSGTGVEVWADLKIRMPAGKELTVRHGVGNIDISSVDGQGFFGIRSGPIEARKLRGPMVLDTGSGHVNVEDAQGNLTVDTGSGHVEGSRLQGEVINVDTGSGRVTLNTVDAGRLVVDTGSGRVRASGVSADSADIDTGSGSVELELDRMGTGRFRIDTGSGSIKLRIPEGTGADVHAETGSGGIDIDLDEAVLMKRKDRDEATFSIGGGGARVDLDTGSGSIRITR